MDFHALMELLAAMPASMARQSGTIALALEIGFLFLVLAGTLLYRRSAHGRSAEERSDRGCRNEDRGSCPCGGIREQCGWCRRARN